MRAKEYTIFSNAGNILYIDKALTPNGVLKKGLKKNISLVNIHMFQTPLSDLDFTDRDMSFGVFINCSFDGCLFTKTYLNHTYFKNCVFTNSNIEDSINDKTVFEDCIF